MNFDLQQPIAAYFTADNHHGKAICQCLTEDAVAKDGGHIGNGRAAINSRKADVLAEPEVPVPLLVQDMPAISFLQEFPTSSPRGMFLCMVLRAFGAWTV